MNSKGGFLVLEVLIAGLILTASIGASMMLFRSGIENMERINRVNLISSKLLQAGAHLKIMDLEKKSGVEDLGDGVMMEWKAKIVATDKPSADAAPEASEAARRNYSHDLFLYRVDFHLNYMGSTDEYSVDVFRSRSLYRR